MLAIHDQFTHQMRDRLGAIELGLGLVRLLQDAGRVEEAKTILSSLENGFPGDAEQSDRQTSDITETHVVAPAIELRSLPIPALHNIGVVRQRVGPKRRSGTRFTIK